MFRTIEEGERPHWVPSEEEIEYIESQDAVSGLVLRELYLSQRFIWSDVIDIVPNSETKLKTVGIKALIDAETDLKGRDIRLVNGILNADLVATEVKIASMPLDFNLLRRHSDYVTCATAYLPGLTLAAMEVISGENNPTKIVAARVAHPIDFEKDFTGMSPRKVGNQFAQFLLGRSPIYSR